MPKVVVCFFALFFFLFFHQSAFAASVNVSNVPTSLNEEQEFTVKVSISGAAANTTNYLRAAFYSEASPTSYYGYTFNHLGNWYNGSPSHIDPHLFLEIQMGPDGTWTGDLKSKADIASGAFKGSGNYYFKIGRYTASATSISDWSQSTPVSISAMAPSPTPTLSPSPLTPQSSSVTKSPSPTAKNSPTSTGVNISSSQPANNKPSVLAVKTQTSPPISTPSASSNPLPQASPKSEESAAKTKIASIFIGSGLILIALAFALYVWYKRTSAQPPIDKTHQDKTL